MTAYEQEQLTSDLEEGDGGQLTGTKQLRPIDGPRNTT